MRRLVGGLVLLGLAIPLLSSLFGLFDRIQHWGKLVHGLEGLLVAVLFGWLLLGWRDRESIDLTDQLATLTTMFVGIVFGVLWEIVEYVLDWIGYSDVQKSNADSMTDFLWNDLAVIAAALLATRLYCRTLRPAQRAELGGLAAGLVGGPSRLLDRHGFLITILAALAIGLAIAALWFTGRPIPGFPSG